MITVSEKDFKRMVDELLNEDEVKYDALGFIVEKHLRKHITYWCRSDFFFKGKNIEIENDILQEFFIRIMHKVVTNFLLQTDKKGEPNDTPEKFSAWLYTSAYNFTMDSLEKAKKRHVVTEPTTSYEQIVEIRKEKENSSDVDDEEKPESIDIYEEEEQDSGVRELVRECFDIVLDSDISIYKTLSWLALSLVMINLNQTKIKSTEYIVEKLKNKTLFKMRDFIYDHDKKLTWLDLSEEQKQRIDNALNAPYTENKLCEDDETDEGDDSSDNTCTGKPVSPKKPSGSSGDKKPLVFGDVKFGSFFMKKGGKASVSDWVNKINKTIKRRVAYETLN